MTNEITRYTNIDDLARTAKMLAMSGYFSTKGDMDVQVAQLATRILAGNELGFGPFASVNNIYIIQGKPVIAANLMASAVKSNPRYDYRVTKLTDTECVITYYQGGELLGISSFTMDDAKKAGLTSKDNWKKWPRNMLFARAMSNGVRLHCPDVFNGNAVYTEDELESEEWHVVDAPAPLPNDEPTPFEEPEPEVVEATPEPAPQSAATKDNECGKIYRWAKSKDQDGGPCSEKQYDFLAGTINNITGGTTHKDILSHMLGRNIDKKNVPSAACASALLDVLLETNENYREVAVDCIKLLHESIRK